MSRVLRRFGHNHKRRSFAEYISFKETLEAAKVEGLSVGEYIERKHLTGGRSALDQTMDGLVSLGLFSAQIESVCELGPGSGRYLQKTIAQCHPSHYEIYETSNEWRRWLVQQYGVVAKKCDGRALAETDSGSVDFVHAHKLFPGLPFLITASYFREMARVVRHGGWVVFDILTEECFSKEHLDAWFNADPWEWAWSPQMTAREYAVGIFAERGIPLVGSFRVPLFPAVTECMVFRKTLPASGGS
jgi:SAM-dependent methyltransferase